MGPSSNLTSFQREQQTMELDFRISMIIQDWANFTPLIVILVTNFGLDDLLTKAEDVFDLLPLLMTKLVPFRDEPEEEEEEEPTLK